MATDHGPSASVPPASAPPDVGVLFLHGIGRQPRGDTLRRFGEPIHDWFRDWIERRHQLLAREISWKGVKDWSNELGQKWRASAGDGPAVARRMDAIRELMASLKRFGDTRRPDALEGDPPVTGGVTLNDAAIRPIDPHVPAHAMLDLMWIHGSGRVVQRRWLLAESWWAESFHAPRFVDLVRWGITGLCWIVGSHYGSRLRKSWRAFRQAGIGVSWGRHLGNVLAAAVYLAAGLVLSAVSLLVLGALLVVSIPPIATLRSWALAIEQRLAASVGDSYMLLASPLTLGSLLSRIRQDCRWMRAQQCPTLVIVAHSQGGALAHLLLRDETPAGLRKLVTFGSGLRKLEELRQMRRSEFKRPRRFATLSVFVTLVTVLAILLGSGGPWPWFWLIWGLGMLATSLYFITRGNATPSLQRWAHEFAQRRIAWDDFYASADPVPNGPLWVDKEEEEALPRSTEVYNFGSLWRDHSAYWRAKDDFVSRVVESIAEVDPEVAAILEHDRADYERAACRREWRVSWLVRARRLAALAALAALWAEWGSWRLVWTSDGFRTVLTESVLGVGTLLMRWLPEWVSPWVVRPLPAHLAERSVAAGVSQAFEAAAAPIALALVGYAVASALWRAWDWSERERFVSAEPYEHFSVGSVWFVLISIGVPLRVIAWAFDAPIETLFDAGPAPWIGTAIFLLLVLAPQVALYLSSQTQIRRPAGMTRKTLMTGANAPDTGNRDTPMKSAAE